MTVLHICSYYKDKFYKKMFNAQCEINNDMIIFYPRKKGTEFIESKKNIISGVTFSTIHRFQFRKKIRLNYKFLTEKIDLKKVTIIHAHTVFSDGAIALKVYKNSEVPYVVSVRGTDINYFFKYRLLEKRIGLDVLRNAQRIICLSNSYKKKLLKLFSEYEREKIARKIIIIPNGVDEFYLDNVYREEKQIHNPLEIITVGEISKRKNQLQICRAIELLDIPVKYKLIGKVVDENYFEKINKYNFVEYVPFLEKETLIEQFRLSDIFVLASTTETFGIVYAEALTQNLPIIYTKGEGFDEQFPDGIVGKNVDYTSKVDIAEKILFIKNNIDKYKKNYERSLKFSWKFIAKQQMNLYENISGEFE